MPEFPDIKDAPEFNPPADLGTGWPWFVWAAICLAVVAICWLLWVKSRNKAATISPPPVPLAPSQMAVKMLEDLKGQHGQIPNKEINQRIVQIFRTWLHRSFGVLANYRTPEEILALRGKKDAPPPPPILAEFEEFLLTTNVLGYRGDAAAEPVVESIDQAIDIIRRASIARTS